jgi:hypothetical protein
MIGTLIFIIVVLVLGYLLWDSNDWTRYIK